MVIIIEVDIQFNALKDKNLVSIQVNIVSREEYTLKIERYQ